MHILSRTELSPLTGRRAVVASLLGAAGTAVCAQLAVHLPWTPVPITMQVFAVLMCGIMLGSRCGALAQLQYLAAGLAGAPVFAGFTAGPGEVVGPTGGYLVGFVAAAFVAGLFVESVGRQTFRSACVAGLLGVITIHTFGVAWLAVWLGPSFPGWWSWLLGAAPFVGVDMVKVVAAAMIAAGSGRRGSGSR